MQIISKELIGIIWKLLESYTEYGSNDNPYNDPSSVSDYGSDQYASLDEDPCMVSLNWKRLPVSFNLMLNQSENTNDKSWNQIEFYHRRPIGLFGDLVLIHAEKMAIHRVDSEAGWIQRKKCNLLPLNIAIRYPLYNWNLLWSIVIFLIYCITVMPEVMHVAKNWPKSNPVDIWKIVHLKATSLDTSTHSLTQEMMIAIAVILLSGVK